MTHLPKQKAFWTRTLADLFLKQGRYREAEAVLRALHADDPSNDAIRGALDTVTEALKGQRETHLKKQAEQWVRLLMLNHLERHLDTILQMRMGPLAHSGKGTRKCGSC